MNKYVNAVHSYEIIRILSHFIRVHSNYTRMYMCVLLSFQVGALLALSRHFLIVGNRSWGPWSQSTNFMHRFPLTINYFIGGYRPQRWCIAAACRRDQFVALEREQFGTAVNSLSVNCGVLLLPGRCDIYDDDRLRQKSPIMSYHYQITATATTGRTDGPKPEHVAGKKNSKIRPRTWIYIRHGVCFCTDCVPTTNNSHNRILFW